MFEFFDYCPCFCVVNNKSINHCIETTDFSIDTLPLNITKMLSNSYLESEFYDLDMMYELVCQNYLDRHTKKNLDCFFGEADKALDIILSKKLFNFLQQKNRWSNLTDFS
jgi:hypothetical protein